MNDFQIDRLSDIMGDLAKGLLLSGFGSVIIKEMQSFYYLIGGTFLGMLFTLLSLKVLELKSK